MKRETLSEKKTRIFAGMAAKDLKAKIISDAKIMLHPETVGTIDLFKVKTLSAKLSGKIVNIEPDPGLEPHKEPDPARWLYYFVNQFLYIENIHLQSKVEIKTDSEVTAILKEFPTAKEMPVTVAYLQEVEQILPGPLKNYKDLKIITVADANQLSNNIYLATGVRVDSTKLSDVKHEAFMKLPLAKKVDVFMAEVKQRKEKEERTVRMVDCLKLNDEKRRKDCLRNCKI